MRLFHISSGEHTLIDRQIGDHSRNYTDSKGCVVARRQTLNLQKEKGRCTNTCSLFSKDLGKLRALYQEMRIIRTKQKHYLAEIGWHLTGDLQYRLPFHKTPYGCNLQHAEFTDSMETETLPAKTWRSNGQLHPRAGAVQRGRRVDRIQRGI